MVVGASSSLREAEPAIAAISRERRSGTASSVPTPVGSRLVVSRRRGRCACTPRCYANPPAVLAGCPPTPAAAYGGVKAKGVSARAHGRRNVADSAIVEGPLALGVGDARSTPTTGFIPTAGWNGTHGPMQTNRLYRNSGVPSPMAKRVTTKTLAAGV